MKRLLTIAAVLIGMAGCTHKKAGTLVKDADGKVYKLRKAFPNESYLLEELDTAEFKKLHRLP